MSNRADRKYKRYGLKDSFLSNGKLYPAYTTMEDGSIRRVFQKTTKVWRKEHGVL